MNSSSRRWIAGLIRVGLVFLAIGVVAGWIWRRTPHREHMRLEREAPPPDSLAAGDLRIYSADSSVDLVLAGDQILAGLSPKTVAKVRRELDTSALNDTNGLAGSIKHIVKQTVSQAIGTHGAFALADIRDVRYEGGQLIFDWKDGGRHQLFGNTKVNGQKVSNSFRAEDARRFIDAVHARKQALGR